MLDAHGVCERVSLARDGSEIYCIEERCRGKGDAVCRVVGRPLEEWGDAITPHLAYYQKALPGCGAVAGDGRAEAVERRLRARRQSAARASAQRVTDHPREPGDARACSISRAVSRRLTRRSC